MGTQNGVWQKFLDTISHFMHYSSLYGHFAKTCRKFACPKFQSLGIGKNLTFLPKFAFCLSLDTISSLYGHFAKTCRVSKICLPGISISGHWQKFDNSPQNLHFVFLWILSLRYTGILQKSKYLKFACPDFESLGIGKKM